MKFHYTQSFLRPLFNHISYQTSLDLLYTYKLSLNSLRNVPRGSFTRQWSCGRVRVKNAQSSGIAAIIAEGHFHLSSLKHHRDALDAGFIELAWFQSARAHPRGGKAKRASGHWLSARSRGYLKCCVMCRGRTRPRRFVLDCFISRTGNILMAYRWLLPRDDDSAKQQSTALATEQRW